MKPTNMKWLPIFAGSIVLIASKGHAAVTLNNGSFETTGTLYLAALGDLYEASGWTNLSPTTNFQASSAVAAGMDGSAPPALRHEALLPGNSRSSTFRLFVFLTRTTPD